MGRYDYYYTPSVARKVEGGIKAQNKRGGFASSWWGRRWIKTLEAFQLGARLTRGRSYARQGQVASLDVTPGKVTAAVQGSRARPYRVTISLKMISASQQKKVMARISEEPIYAAQLLGGDMPEGVEHLFDDAGAPLFPKHHRDLETDCSCPDWSNPCKHIAAVYYLLAEAFDQDPFLLFKLRGIDREQFLGELDASEIESEDAEFFADEPLPSDHEQFWGTHVEQHPIALPSPCRIHAALPKRLGQLPFWRAEQEMKRAMEQVYQIASDGVRKYLDKTVDDDT